MKSDLSNLRNILIEVFNEANVPIDIMDLKIDSLSQWDSMGNFSLLLAVEEHFKIKFSFDEIQSLKSVKSIYKVINDR